MLFSTIKQLYYVAEPKEHWASKAEELKKNRKFEEAIEILDKVKELEKEEKEEDYWYKKAENYCEIGEYEKAKDALDKDLEIHRKSFRTFFLLGKISFELQRYEESLEWYNKSMEEHNSRHLRNTHKIDQMKSVNKFEEAVKYSDLVYQEKPLDDDYWDHRGRTLFKLKKFKESLECFEKILETNSDNPNILYRLAKSELFIGNKKKSLELLEKACILEPLVKEELRIDKDFENLSQEKQMRIIMGL